MPAAVGGGPGWLLGIYGEGTGLGAGPYLAFLCLAFVAYLFVLAGAESISRRLLWSVIVIAVLAFALAPPLLSQDVFSYISYARLGADHGLNPYTHTPADYAGDPAFIHVGWPDTVSAYGPLFTLLSYPLGSLPVAAALWLLKGISAASVLGVAAICARLAPGRGVDPRTAAAFVALNPLVLVHVVGGAHNDALAMLMAMAGVAGVLALREAAGAVGLIAAAAIKVSSLFIAPFALLGSVRQGRLALGAAISLALLAAAALVAFGPHALDAVGLAGENQARNGHRSISYLLSLASGIDVDAIRALALAAYAGALAWLLRWVWRGEDWVRASGWAGFGLLLASGWVLPWYLIWPLPLAAISRDRPLAVGVLALTALHLATRVPI